MIADKRDNIEIRIIEAVQKEREANRLVRISSIGSLVGAAITSFGTYKALEEKIGYILVIIGGVALLAKYGCDFLKYLSQKSYYRRIAHEERNKLRMYDRSRSAIPVSAIENV